MPDVRISVDGEDRTVCENTSVAAAVLAHGGGRRSVSGELRQPLCGMGVCHECRVVIDGRICRGCMVLCRAGMEVRTDG